MPRLWERDPEQAKQSLEDLRRLTHGAMAEMRAMLVEFRITALTDSNLVEMVQLLCDAFTGRTDIPVTLNVIANGSQDQIPAEVHIAFYRVCQEALNNIAKHARAIEVVIELHYHPKKIELQIQDDGSGFDLTQTPAGHYGLAIMKERAESVGATLSITSQPGKGTQIRINWSESPR